VKSKTEVPVEVRLALLKSPRQLGRACGRSRSWINMKQIEGELPFTVVGDTRMSTLDDLWRMIQRDTDAERERLAEKRRAKK
jgi:hypothetical protein